MRFDRNLALYGIYFFYLADFSVKDLLKLSTKAEPRTF